MMRPYLWFFVMCLTLSSVARGQSCDALNDLQWMLGNWEAQSEKRVTHESWVQVSPQTYEGAGHVVSKATGEISSAESIRLVAMSGEMFYIPKAAHNALPIAFKLTDCSSASVVFENKDHDFPRQLKYERVGSDSLFVYVSDGEKRGFVLRFGKK